MSLPHIYNFQSLDAAINDLGLDCRIDHSFIDISRYISEYHNIKTIIIEDRYIDRDFSNEFSNLYSKTFRSRYGYCQRLHFIKESFSDENDFNLKFNDNQFTYLGYLIRRPVEVGKVGRTLILPKEMNNFYYLCCIKRDIHLLGKTIQATGVPFIQQDAMVITCAQAGIWMVAKYMHQAHSLPRHLPFDITEKATSGFGITGRAIPSAGLTIEQMTVALNNMGYFPI